MSSESEGEAEQDVNVWGLTYNPYARLKEFMQKKHEDDIKKGIKTQEQAQSEIRVDPGKRLSMHERLALAFKRKHILQQLQVAKETPDSEAKEAKEGGKGKKGEKEKESRKRVYEGLVNVQDIR